MFTNNQFVSQDLQDAIKKIMNGDSVEEAKIVHPNQQRIDVHEPEKDEITADDFKKLRGMKKEKPMKEDTEEVEQFDEKVNVFHSTSPGADMKRFPKDSSAPDAKAHRDATATAVKGLRKTGEMNRKSLSYGSTGDMKTSKGGTVTAMRVKEEVEVLDELSKSTLSSYKTKATRSALDFNNAARDFKQQGERRKSDDFMKSWDSKLSQKYKEKTQKRKVNVYKAADRLTKEEADQHEYTFADYLEAARAQYVDKDAVLVANEAFKNQDITLFSDLKEAKVDPITHHQNMYDHHSQYAEIHSDASRDAEDEDDASHHDSAEEEHQDSANAHKEALDAHKNNSPNKKELSSYANSQSKRTKSFYGDSVEEAKIIHPTMPKPMKEDAEELDELKKSTVGSYIRKKFDKMSGEPASKNPNEIFAKKDAKGIQRAGLRMSGIKATQKESIDFFDDADEVTVLKSLDIEIQESYTFGDYLTAAKDIVGEEAAIDLANYAFNKQDTALFVEQVTRSDIQSKINTHVAAGHKVSEPKYITKDGKLHAEYVVTDKESGIRRKYIQHGTMRKVENMGAKGKKDSE